MKVAHGPGGPTLTSADGRVALGPLVSNAVTAGQATEAAGRLATEIDVVELDDGQIEIRVRALNHGTKAQPVEHLRVFETSSLRVGDDASRWRIYRNGYQSWSGTQTIGVSERDRDLPGTFARTAATDARHRAPTGRGHVRSDAVTAVVEPGSGDALAISFTTLGEAFAFVELDAPDGEVRSLSAWVDLDGLELDPGAASPWYVVRLVAVTDDRRAGSHALRQVIEAAGDAMGARGTDRHHPGGWCSWYYYFAKVTEADVLENLGVLAADGRDGPAYGCEYVMVDDGHQSAIGDWLSPNAKFPSGMAALAGHITAAGFDAGIWWAPFLASARSRVALEHPEWLVRNRRGKPILGLLNPAWGMTTPMRVLDTTHPEVLEHVADVARTIGETWGYRIQKLDFLYAAALAGTRHDSNATRAQALRRGLEAVRRGAGDDAFLLGCGCPLGPAVGVVDAMRIGADVTPAWTSTIGRTLGRNRHGLATAHAILNTLTRSVFDGAWFLNDPDCLMVRDTETRLSEEEVRLLATVFAMTNGMLVLSDRLDLLPDDRRNMIAWSRALAGGEAEVVDLFERARPEVLVSRHGDGRVDVGVLTLGSPRSGVVDLAALGLPAHLVPPDGSELTEYWTGQKVLMRGSVADAGLLPPHSARVLRLGGPA